MIKNKRILLLFVGVLMLLIMAACSRDIKVVFEVNGGTAITDYIVPQGTIIEEPTIKRTGYTFLGWFESKEFEETSRFTFENKVNRNLKLYAKWQINTYTLKLTPNNSEVIADRSIEFGKDINLPTLTKEGHGFDGWYTNPEFTGQKFTARQMPAENLQLYAKWNIFEYSIRFFVDDEVYVTKTVEHGNDLLDVPAPPVKEGKVRAWDIVDFTNITEDLDVFLIEEDAYYTVTIKDEFGTIFETLTVKHGDNFVPTVTPTKEGYTFLGYNPGTDFEVKTNLEVLVVYERIVYNVFFVNHLGTLIKEVKVNHGEDAQAPSYSAPEGYNFDGWSGSFTNVKSNLTITATISPKTYLLILDAAGGKFLDNNEVKTIEKEYQSNVGIPETPHRLGYQFGGWFENEEGTGTAYVFSPSSSMPLNGLKLYAKWHSINYTITYLNLNGMAHTNPTTFNITSPTIIFSNPTSRTGYTFVGWFDELVGGNQVMELEHASTIGNIILYARWEAINYSITYVLESGLTHSNPTSFTIQTPLIVFTNPSPKTGYTFLGWYNEAVGGSKVESLLLGSTGNKTFYARWQANTYTITFDLDGGVGPASLEVTYDENFTLGAASKLGYTFTGWTYLGNSFGDGKWELTENIVLKANYQVIDYSINYNNLEGVSHSNPATYNIETATITLTDPSARNGYTFVGWFDSLVGGNKIEEIETASTGEKVVFARWEVVTYLLTFDNLQGTTEGNPNTYNIETATFTLTDPNARLGYTFTGWYTELSGGSKVEEVLKGSTGNKILYARWEVITYTISYGNLNGVSHSNPTTFNIESPTITFVNPTPRTGFTFLGWYDNITGGNKVEEIIAGSTGSKTVYARWQANEYIITYDLDGGIGPESLNVVYNSMFTLGVASKVGFTFSGWLYQGEPFESGQYTFDHSITVVANWTVWPRIEFDFKGGSGTQYISQAPGTAVNAPTNPVRAGYTFVYWYELDEEVEYVFTIMPNEDITLLAKWQAIDYSISYNNLEGTTHSNPNLYNIETATITLTDPSLRSGYTFVGWFDTLTGGSEVDEIELGSMGNLDLYARWEAKTYIIYYNTNGGDILEDTLEVTYNEPFTLASATKVGFTFVGWTYEDDPFTSGIWTFTESIVIKAVYQIISYDLEYENLFGSTHSNSLSYNVESVITLTDPTARNHYTFVGWFDALTSGNKIEEIEYGTTGNLTLYARWEAVEYSLTFDNLQGTTHTNPNSYNIETTTITLTAPTARSGYIFIGWYTQNVGGTKVEAIVLGSTGNKVLYARWSPINYSITYSNLEGMTHSNPSTYNIESIIMLTDPSLRTGYTFVGWFDSLTGGNKIEEIEAGSAGTLTLYARWEVVEYLLDFENLQGTVHSNPLTYTIEDGFILEEPGIRTGFSFIGWFDDEDSGSRVLEVVVGTTGNLTLYARWEVAYYDVSGTVVFEKYDISFDQEEIEVTKTTESTTNFFMSQILHGTQISPIINYQGYVFVRFVYDGVEYTNIEELITVVGNIQAEDLTIYYDRIILEVAFTQKVETGDAFITEIRYVYYNDELLNVSIPQFLYSPINQTVMWERSVFKNIIMTTDVSAVYYIYGNQSIRFVDGNSIIYIASVQNAGIGEDENTIFITEASLLWDLKRSGYKFLGWYYLDGGVEIALIKGSYKYNDFPLVGITEIYTKWEALPKYNKPEVTDVEVDEENEITIEWTHDYESLDIPTFEFVINQILVDSYITVVSQVGNTFTLTISSSSADFELFAALADVGMHSVRVRAIGDDETVVSSDLSDTFIFEKESIYDTPPEAVNVYNYFIIEEYKGSSRYIFYTNMTYQFNDSYSFEILTGTSLVTLENDYTMKMNNISGEFRFKLNKPGQPSVIYDALIIKDVKQFTYGNNYQTYLRETNIDSSSYKLQDAPYFVGTKNPFMLDIRLSNTRGNQILLSDAHLKYDFYLFNGAEYVLIPKSELDDHVQMLPNNKFEFESGTEGNEYKIVVQPLYQASNMFVEELVYEVKINDGYNAFSHADLKDLYSDESVKKINLHANITPILSNDQLNADGSPKNVRNGKGNVYSRNYSSSNLDNLVIEGNFMTINGSNLPYSNARSGSGNVGYAEAFEIVNVQVGIFNYDVSGNEDNLFTINNLQIIGNTTVPSVNFGGTAEEILLQERLMSRNSGGYVGVMISNGSTNFTNMQVRFTVLGFDNNAYGEDVKMTLDHIIVDDIWANGLYVYGGSWTSVNNSFFGQSGGPAFHIVDSRQGSGPSNINTPVLELNNTVIENYISGEEAWFKAYGMSSLALQLKSQISQGIAPTGRDIIKLVTHPVTGVQTEMLNFILLTEPSNLAVEKDGESNTIGASEVIIIIDGKVIYRPFYYLSVPDPRIDDGKYAFPIGLYSDVNDFAQLATDIGAYAFDQYGQVLAEAQIANLATLASFYNMTAIEVVNALMLAGGNPANMVLPTEGIPKYFEVLSPLPVFPDGFANIIMGLE